MLLLHLNGRVILAKIFSVVAENKGDFHCKMASLVVPLARCSPHPPRIFLVRNEGD